MDIGQDLGHVTEDAFITYKNQSIALAELLAISEQRLEGVFPLYPEQKQVAVTAYNYQTTSWPKPLLKTDVYKRQCYYRNSRKKRVC